MKQTPKNQITTTLDSFSVLELSDIRILSVIPSHDVMDRIAVALDVVASENPGMKMKITNFFSLDYITSDPDTVVVLIGK